MRIASTLAALALAVSPAAASEIREFDVPTLERLGRELSRRDAIAARATDLVLKEHPVARSLKMRGWITELKKDGDAVHFIADAPSGPTLAYTVSFRQPGTPEVQDMRGQSLPPQVAVRFKARETAAAAVKGRLFNAPYNFEIVDDPDGSGFLVYALAASAKAEQFVLGGHVRVTVSADGTKAERVDALSKTLLYSSDGKSELPVDAQPVALFMMQLVSDKPVETLIYTANMAKKDIYVGTPDRKMWIVGNGKIRVDTSKPGKRTEGEAARKALSQ